MRSKPDREIKCLEYHRPSSTTPQENIPFVSRQTRLFGNPVALNVVAVAAGDGEVITGTIVLANVLGVGHSIGGRVVSASKDGVLAVPVEKVGVKEDAGSTTESTVLSVVLSLSLARGSAQRRVVRDVGAECLRAEIAVIDHRRRSIDRGVSERDWALQLVI